MPSYPLPTLAAQITAVGVTAPPFTDILESLKASVRGIFGSDVIIDADSQDGQLIAIFAKAIDDVNGSIKGTYASFAPSGAIGAGLSANVKINGLRRDAATNSSAQLIVNGTPGTPLGGLLVRSSIDGTNWKIAAGYNIPGGGTGVVTATCQTAGAVTADPGTLIIKATPVSGWLSVSNPADATVGTPTESDSLLRQRQAASVALASETRLAAIRGAVLSVFGVTGARIYENVTGTTDGDGVPAHAVALVIDGGDATEVATAIMNKKTPGCNLYGSTSVVLVDAVGLSQTMRWTVPSFVNVKVAVDLNALVGYTADVGVKIQQALVDWLNALPSGDDVYWSRLFEPANLITRQIDDTGKLVLVQDPDAQTYKINTLLISVGAGSPSPTDIAINFGQEPQGILGNMTITPH